MKKSRCQENCHLKIANLFGYHIAITIFVRYRVLGFEESGVRIRDSGVKILVYLMRLGNAIDGLLYVKSMDDLDFSDQLQ